MKWFAWVLLLAAVAWAQGGPVWAQEPSVRLDLTLSRKKPPVVTPAPDPEVARKDAEQAVAELEARKRDEEVLRAAVPSPSRRPDLSYDVWSGIQSRNVRDALRRR